MAAENRSAPSAARTTATGMTTEKRVRRFGQYPEWAHVGVILRPTEVQRGAGYAGILLDALRRDRRHRATDEGHIVRGAEILRSVRKILSAHHTATCTDDTSPGRFGKTPPTPIATQTIIVNGQAIAPVIFADGTAIVFIRDHAMRTKGAPAWRYPPWAWRLEGAAAFTPPDSDEGLAPENGKSTMRKKTARSRGTSRAVTIRGEVTCPAYTEKTVAQANIRIEWQRTPVKADRSWTKQATLWPAPNHCDGNLGAEDDLAERNAAKRCFTEALGRDLEAISKAALAAPTQDKSCVVDDILHPADLITSTRQRLTEDANALIASAVLAAVTIAANEAAARDHPTTATRITPNDRPMVILLGASHNTKAGFAGKGPGGHRAAMIVAEALRRRGVKIDIFGQKYTRSGNRYAGIMRDPIAYFHPTGSETGHQVLSALKEWPEIKEIVKESGPRGDH